MRARIGKQPRNSTTHTHNHEHTDTHPRTRTRHQTGTSPHKPTQQGTSGSTREAGKETHERERGRQENTPQTTQRAHHTQRHGRQRGSGTTTSNSGRLGGQKAATKKSSIFVCAAATGRVACTYIQLCAFQGSSLACGAWQSFPCALSARSNIDIFTPTT